MGRPDSKCRAVLDVVDADTTSLEQLAQAVPTLADLYDPILMPTIRQEAHHSLEPLAVDSVPGVRQCHILRSTF